MSARVNSVVPAASTTRAGMGGALPYVSTVTIERIVNPAIMTRIAPCRHHGEMPSVARPSSMAPPPHPSCALRRVSTTGYDVAVSDARSAHGPKTTDRTAALLPPCFFAPAVGFFALALLLAPAVIGELRVHFYQPHVLALVHMLTLGWISMVMMGVLYRYVPGLTKRPVPFPRLAVVQWASFVAGTTALIGAFWTGSWPTATAAAATLAASAVLLCANLWPMLRAARRLGVAELGVGLATTALVAAAILGTLLAADKPRGFLGGDVVTNPAAHAHSAALGWVGLTVCALSFRFLPAFLLPTAEVTDAARRLVALLAAAVVALVAALWWRSALTPVAALAVVAALAAYATLAARVVRTHRLPLDWTARHAIASIGWCLVAAAAGLA